jgi:hypothetical protein
MISKHPRPKPISVASHEISPGLYSLTFTENKTGQLSNINNNLILNGIFVPGICIAGGSVVSHITNRKSKSDLDFFIYGQSPEQALNIANQTVLRIANNHMNIYDTYPKIINKHKCVTISGYGIKLDIVYMLYSSIQELLNSFDLSVSRFAYDGSQYLTVKSGLDFLATESFKPEYDKIHDAIGKRIVKYINRGYAFDYSDAPEYFMSILANELTINVKTRYLYFYVSKNEIDVVPISEQKSTYTISHTSNLTISTGNYRTDIGFKLNTHNMPKKIHVFSRKEYEKLFGVRYETALDFYA